MIWKQRSGRLLFEASPGKRFGRPYLNQWLGMVACTSDPQLLKEAQIGES
jgi:hypothetical protein